MPEPADDREFFMANIEMTINPQSPTIEPWEIYNAIPDPFAMRVREGTIYDMIAELNG